MCVFPTFAIVLAMESSDIHWLLICLTSTSFLLLLLVENYDEKWWFGKTWIVLVLTCVNKGLIWGINYIYYVNVYLYTHCILIAVHCIQTPSF